MRLLATLLSGARVRVLAALLANPDRESYLREIARAAGVPLRAVQRELALYQSIGLISRRPRGREVFIAVDRSHPLFAGLRALLVTEVDMPGSAAPDPAGLESAPAGIRRKGVSSGKDPRQSARHVPAADESWRMW